MGGGVSLAPSCPGSSSGRLCCTGSCTRRAIPTAWIALTLREGRNRQVRRMTAAVGHPTLRLVRAAIGPYTLDGLAPGEWAIVEEATSP